MATDFPTGLDALTNPTATDYLNSPSHAGQHANANDAIEALQAKLGIDSSAVTTSHDYKLSEITGTDKAVGKTATQTLTNKTLTAPVLNGALSGDAKATGATITTGTDDDDFVTSKALADATVGKLGAAWASWVPSFANLTIGNATVVAKYSQIGKTINFRVKITIGSTTSVGTAPYLTLPVTAASGLYSDGLSILGLAGLLDNGTGYFQSICTFRSTTTAYIQTFLANETYGKTYRIAAADPFTWATGDIIEVAGTYEAA